MPPNSVGVCLRGKSTNKKIQETKHDKKITEYDKKITKRLDFPSAGVYCEVDRGVRMAKNWRTL